MKRQRQASSRSQKVPQEPREGEPAIGLDHHGSPPGGRTGALPPRRPPAPWRHCRRPRRRRRAPRRACRAARRSRSAAPHARRSDGGRWRSGSGNGPVAHAFLPGGQHDLPRKERIGAVAGLTLAASSPSGAGEIAPAAQPLRTGMPATRAEPEQIVRPELLRDQVELSPMLRAELAPRARTGRSGSGISRSGPGEMLRAAQRVHAGIGEPGALPPSRTLSSTRMLLTCERSSPNAVASPDCPAPTMSTSSAGLSSGAEFWRQPRGIRMRGLGQIGAQPGLRARQGRWFMPRASRRRPPSRCRS